MEADRVLAILSALEREGVQYKIVGGIALNLHGIVRATEDLDLFIAPSADNVERLKTALKSVFQDPNIDEISAADLAGEYPAIQYVPPDGLFWIDLIARLGSAFDYESVETEEQVVEGLRVVVATPLMLYRMKKDTVRLQDKADAQKLRERFGLEEP